tara:strand:+ start:38 stop:280 length:243 start_codon:yes stop_codon:yes gene_type:complete
MFKKNLNKYFIKIGILINLKKISEENIPKKAPKTILIIQLKKEINRVSFNLTIDIFIISLLIFGVKADLIKSRNNSNPPR